MLKARYFRKEKPEDFLNLLFFNSDMYMLDEAVIKLSIEQIKHLKKLGYFPNSVSMLTNSYNGLNIEWIAQN